MPLPIALANRLMNTIADNAYLSLHTDEPGNVGGNEVRGNGYNRQPIDFEAASDGMINNSGDIGFVFMPGVTVTHIALWDSPENGELLWTASLDEPRPLSSGDNLGFSPGRVSFGFDL